MLSRGTTYAYTSHLLTQITNPLGQIVEQMQYDSATAAAKVTQQWLQDGQHLQFQYLPDTTVITTYLYGLDRLAAVAGSSRTWYVGDALGSVRLTLDDVGAPLGVVKYDLVTKEIRCDR